MCAVCKTQGPNSLPHYASECFEGPGELSECSLLGGAGRKPFCAVNPQQRGKQMEGSQPCQKIEVSSRGTQK